MGGTQFTMGLRVSLLKALALDEFVSRFQAIKSGRPKVLPRFGTDTMKKFWADIADKTQELHIKDYGELEDKYASVFTPRRMQDEYNKLRADVKAAIGGELRSGGGRVSAAQLAAILQDPTRDLPALRPRRGARNDKQAERAAELRKLVVDYAVKRTSFFSNRIVGVNDWSGTIDDDRADEEEVGLADTSEATEAAAAAGATPTTSRPSSDRVRRRPSDEGEASTAAEVASEVTQGSLPRPRKRQARQPPRQKEIQHKGTYAIYIKESRPPQPPCELQKILAKAIGLAFGDLEAVQDAISLRLCPLDNVETRAMLTALLKLVGSFSSADADADAVQALYDGMKASGTTLREFRDQCEALFGGGDGEL